MTIERIRRMFSGDVPYIPQDPKENEDYKKGIICCLQGGMGNQMFQYAMAKSISMKLNVPLFLNIHRFDSCNMRQYSLGLWEGVTEPIIPNEYNRIFEQGMPYNEHLLRKVKEGTTLVGYWQTEKYFLDIKKTLQKTFVPKQRMTDVGLKTLSKIKAAGNRSVFLTVRRTDYVNSDFHNVLSKDYYDKAISIIAKKVDPIIFIFSDEPEWCKENMNLGYETIIGGNYDMTTKTHLGREDEELYLMMHCKHAILANSSYSWWGAWLNDNPGIRIAPKKWFETGKEDSRDIVPSDWIRI